MRVTSEGWSSTKSLSRWARLCVRWSETSTGKKEESFRCEEVNVLMTHIGGYPGKYAPGITNRLNLLKPKLFVCGHSHILKAQYDPTRQMLCLNPGAAGTYGFHQVRTLMRFVIDGADIRDLEVIEMNC